MTPPTKKSAVLEEQYQSVVDDVTGLIDAARRSAARSVNAVMTAAYWLVGRYIVEFEQAGEERAEYRAALIERLASDLTKRFGRGFSRQNIWQMRLFYQTYPPQRILQTPSGESELIPSSPRPETASAESSLADITSRFPLPWSAYVRLLSVKNLRARQFYETEALRGGWSVRQIDRQIDSQFYERTALSKNKAAMLTRGPEGTELKTLCFPRRKSKTRTSSNSWTSKMSTPRAISKKR